MCIQEARARAMTSGTRMRNRRQMDLGGASCVAVWGMGARDLTGMGVGLRDTRI